MAFLESYFGAFDRIEGWFSRDAALMFMACNEVMAAHGVAGDVLEIGVHHGLSTIALAAMRGDGARLVGDESLRWTFHRSTRFLSRLFERDEPERAVARG